MSNGSQNLIVPLVLISHHNDPAVCFCYLSLSDAGLQTSQQTIDKTRPRASENAAKMTSTCFTLGGGVYLKVCPNALSFTDPESMKSLSKICLSIKDTLYISCHHQHYLISVSKRQWKCTRKHILGASVPLVSELPSAGKDGNAAWIIADWSPHTFSPSLPVKPDGCAPSWYLLLLPFCLTRWSLPHCWHSSDGPEQEQLPLIFTPETNSCPL